jgi:hypothetical protein
MDNEANRPNSVGHLGRGVPDRASVMVSASIRKLEPGLVVTLPLMHDTPSRARRTRWGASGERRTGRVWQDQRPESSAADRLYVLAVAWPPSPEAIP